ncbi:MAG: Pyruvate-utilizing enzyme, similar to phosphoenolpyruvate synthase [uncultured Chthoniobacterales bacterium]|uniref:Pyruvate-utilizing enzyme, similar to phosphoenolpyruvate synthase n=1 Tax=uncultured Chthoniobacterales bacterium TaxID=1836801 RepID=A0A6J4II10_9BACT|nr:MAG: Pyruvate-utilizing enzyme, similar to phosphoenolpyruvate synthase [uncultured Chthoniobacterales bacterium]
MKFIIAPPVSADAAGLGGKARALAALSEAHFPVPAWFVISPEAFRASGADPSRDVAVSNEVREEISRAMAQLAPGEHVAVRSSASDEDGAQHSFAGQLESYLFVSPEDVPAKVAAVWRSGFSERIRAYRREHGLSEVPPSAPAVLVQRMIDADVSGVAFGVDPVSGRSGIAVVSAVFGLGTALVSGEADADTYHVDRSGNIALRSIADKTVEHRQDSAAAEGVRSQPVDLTRRKEPALTDKQVRSVAELVRRAGRYFGRPQDIEWAIEGGVLHLLQSRPITSLGRTADPDGELNIWDNSNIAESYSGVTTPLTFSFARGIYEEVYRQFCKILHVPEAKIAANGATFARMLGLIRGRVYYNLVSWYRVLALLPGYQLNRRFMESMMGVKEPMPPEALPPGTLATTPGARLRDALDAARSVYGLVVQHLFIERSIERFHVRLAQALRKPPIPLSELRADELAQAYRDLERQLLTRWDAPLVNDFFAMIFYGVAKRLAEKWCGDANGSLQNDLLRNEGGMISAEPARRVRELAQLCAAGGDELVGVFCEGSLSDVEAALATQPALQSGYNAYLEKFGERCLEELKLESATLHDDPTSLVRSIGQFAKVLQSGSPVEKPVSSTSDRDDSEGRVRQALAGHRFKQRIFFWVLRNARARVRDRENLRFERTRLFGRVRQIFVEIGRRWRADDVLDDARDIFYLTVEEILGWIEGTAATVDLRGLVAVRKAEFAQYRSEPAPADRFETRGTVHLANSFRATSPAPKLAPGTEQLRGLGCCPGVVRGRARVILEPRGAVIHAGEILVARRTDPGWIMLFPSAAGLLVEHGSMLSHSAIVARELGIPAIVSISGVTEWLHDGDWVELDGSSGIATRVTGPRHE